MEAMVPLRRGPFKQANNKCTGTGAHSRADATLGSGQGVRCMYACTLHSSGQQQRWLWRSVPVKGEWLQPLSHPCIHIQQPSYKPFLSRDGG